MNLYIRNQEDDIDNIPTKENGERINQNSTKKAKALQYRSLNPLGNELNLDEKIEANEKQRILEVMIKKHKEQMIRKSGGVVQTEYTKQINQKISQIKKDMQPLLNTLSKRTNELSNYPFTNNLLSKACSKLVCVNSEKITELIIDEILIELVGILNENEQREIHLEEGERRQFLLDDFMEAVKDLQCDQDEILNERNNFHEQNKMRDIEESKMIKLDKKDYYQIIETKENFVNKILKDKLSLDTLMNEKSLSDRKMVNKTKEVSEMMVNMIYDEVFEEFEKVQDEFVEKLYEQEFFQK